MRPKRRRNILILRRRFISGCTARPVSGRKQLCIICSRAAETSRSDKTNDQVVPGRYLVSGLTFITCHESTSDFIMHRPRLPAQSVSDIVKIYAERVGLDPAAFAGHSMRSGFLTSAAKRGASIFKMMDQSRHRSVETLRGYVRDAEIFKEHAGAGLL
jgi:hypothetical protein